MTLMQKIVLSFMSKGFCNWMPDSLYLKLRFPIRTGEKLNLKNPETFNEKLQWLKINDRKPIYSDMVDKYEVKNYVAEKLGEEYIIPTLGIWDKFEDIDFNALPDQFVLKCTHDSGGLAVCTNKAEFDVEKAKEKIERCFKRNYYWSSREWPYKNVKPRIIAEKYMEDENAAEGLTDYKFFCFGGKPKLLYVSQGLQDHATAAISFYDLEGNEMPFHRKDFRPIDGKMVLPEKFDEMVKIAEKLAKEVDNPFIRIDLYSICGKIYFSEITFFPCSGMMPIEPEEWNKTLGDWIELPKK
ncbi:MAG: glycosyl transferase [Clostridia bacterium]|nr:glycosyl transferase [Clostridia bacterium]